MNACCHHWVIETPNGPTSSGVCKFCGDERTFVNAEPAVLLLLNGKARAKQRGASSQAQQAMFYEDITSKPGVWWS